MLGDNLQEKTRAVEDFRRLRQQASMQEILAAFTGQPLNLLSYEDIRRRFRVSTGSYRGLQDIPLQAIVGSVSRYNDFNRNFLPRRSTDGERWARVKAAMLGLNGVPPIEAYKIGDVYFVVDGNHRVSVARQLGNSHIQGYVTEFQTKVPLKPEDQPDDLIIKAEYAGFLERTKLDELRPDVDLQMTAPGRYWELETQIEAHRYLLGQVQKREITYPEAVESWYDQVYLPTIRLIRERGILSDFPGRTETDLYLWIFRHRVELTKKLGWQVDAEAAALDLAPQQTDLAGSLAARVEERLGEDQPAKSGRGDPGPAQGLQPRPRDQLFGSLLVALNGETQSWAALDQALVIAQYEGSQIFGLTVTAQPDNQAAQAVRAEFNRRCQEAGIVGQFSAASGGIARTIIDRSRWADLLVVHLAHPPGLKTLSKLSSGFHTLLHRSPRPLLAVPGPATPLKKALLAYDGSLKAQEGLYIATYLARYWPTSLVVISVIEQEGDKEKLKRAQSHLAQRGAAATFVFRQGNVAEAILQTAADYEADLIIMGSYGAKPIVEVVLGSVVDHVLRESRLPMLICR